MKCWRIFIFIYLSIMESSVYSNSTRNESIHKNYQKTMRNMQEKRFSEYKCGVSSEMFHNRIDVTCEDRRSLVEQMLILHNCKNIEKELCSMFEGIYEGVDTSPTHDDAVVFQAVSVMDRYIQQNFVPAAKTRYLGVAAFYLASGFELPLYLLSNEHVQNIERISVELQDVQLIPSSVEYLEQLFSLLQFLDGEEVLGIAKLILKITLLDPVSTHFYPSELASTAMIMALHMLELPLPENLMECCGYPPNSLNRVERDCARIIFKYQLDAYGYFDPDVEKVLARLSTENYLRNLFPLKSMEIVESDEPDDIDDTLRV